MFILAFFVNCFGARRLIRKVGKVFLVSIFSSFIDFKISNGSSSQIQIFSKRKQFIFFTHRQTNCVFFSHDVSLKLFFFSWREKKDSKSVNIASFEDLTKEESISSANVALILLSIFFISSVSSVYFYYLLGTQLCDIIYFFISGHSDV